MNSSELMSGHSGVSRQARPNAQVEPTTTHLRPKRSARMPPIIANRNTPTALALKNMPICAGVKP